MLPLWVFVQKAIVTYFKPNLQVSLPCILIMVIYLEEYQIFCHVNSSDMAILSHQFAQDVAVSTRPTSQIQNGTSLQFLWNHQATT